MDIVGRVTLSASGMVGNSWFSPGRLAILLIGPFCGLVFGLLQSLVEGIPDWATYGVVIVAAMVYIRLLTAFNLRRARERAARTILAEGRCPCCLYKLVEVVPQEDGAVQCPECGAAWLASRVGSLRSTGGANERAATRPRPWALRLTGAGHYPITEDAHQRLVRLVDVRLTSLTRALGPQRGREVWKRAKKKYRTLAICFSAFTCLINIPAFLFLTCMPTARFASGITLSLVRVGTMGIGVLFALIMLGMCWRSLTGRWQFSARAVACTLVQEGVCASCAASIAELSPQADGCVTCAACGAAWKRPGAAPPGVPEPVPT